MMRSVLSHAIALQFCVVAAAPGQGPVASRTPPELPFLALFQAECGPRWIDRAAQALAESKLDPDVVAKDGGQGLGQAMPKTWQEYGRRGWVPAGASPFDPSMAIRGMHAYDRWLEAQVPVPDGYLVAYNAGLRSALRSLQWAQDLQLDGPDAILRALPRVTGEKNAAITTAYVGRNRVNRAKLHARYGGTR